MNYYRHAIYLLLTLSVIFSSALSAGDFSSFLQRVQKRDQRTKAIVRVRASEETKQKHGITDFWYFEIKAEGKIATAKVFNNYKTGPIEETYTFDIDDDVQQELRRYQNRQELIVLDAAVEKAERQRRVFMLSDFQLKAGATNVEIERVLGKPEEISYPTEAGSLRLRYPGLYVSIRGNRLWDIQLKRD